MASEFNVRIFTADIIYHLFDQVGGWVGWWGCKGGARWCWGGFGWWGGVRWVPGWLGGGLGLGLGLGWVLGFGVGLGVRVGVVEVEQLLYSLTAAQPVASRLSWAADVPRAACCRCLLSAAAAVHCLHEGDQGSGAGGSTPGRGVPLHPGGQWCERSFGNCCSDARSSFAQVLTSLLPVSCNVCCCRCLAPIPVPGHPPPPDPAHVCVQQEGPYCCGCGGQGGHRKGGQFDFMFDFMFDLIAVHFKFYPRSIN